MNRIEYFESIVNEIAGAVSEFESQVDSYTETPVETFVRVADYGLQEMDKFLIFENQTDDDASKYLGNISKLAQLGMMGHQYTVGGEKNFTLLATQMTETYKRKNADYGDSFSQSVDKYGPLAAHIRMNDKINRLKSLVLRKQTAQVNDESIADTFLDLACYAIMLLVYLEMKSAKLDEEKEVAHEG